MTPSPNPRMRTVRLTGESLAFTPNYVDTEELRSDRMLPDPVKVMQASEGGINFELSYPDDESPLSEIYRSAFFSTWVNTPTFFNDGTADSVVTDAGTVSDTYAVTSGGAAVKAGHLVRATGFANDENNQIFRVASSTSTTIVGGALGLVAETAPHGAAQLKVVGFQGASGDISVAGSATQSATSATVVDDPGSGGVAPGDVLTLTDDTGIEPTFTVTHTTIVGTPSIDNAGSGGDDGACVLEGTTGTGTKFRVLADIVAGAIDSLGAVEIFGDYTVNPTDLSSEPVVPVLGGAGLTGAALTIDTGALEVELTTSGAITAIGGNPTSTTSDGDGSGTTLTVAWSGTAASLQSLVLDFTTLGLAVGQWIKIGGTGSAFRFVTTPNNAWVRVTSVAAHSLGLDNLPSVWDPDDGSGKTIRVWFGDQIKNGVVPTSLTIEKGFLDQSVPTYIVNTGMQVNTLQHTITSRRVITGSAAFMGMGGGESTTSLDNSPDAATSGRVIAANANVGRLAEAGATLTDPNWSREVSVQISNNLRTIEAVDSSSPVALAAGECTVTGRLSTYFGSDTLLKKLYAGTATAVNCRVQKDSQAMIWQLPRVTLRTGVPAASAKNQDAMLDADYQSSLDPLTNSVIILDRLSYYEN